MIQQTLARIEPLVPGEPTDVVVVLLPTAYRVRRGHVLRLALGGQDERHFDTPGVGKRVLSFVCGRSSLEWQSN